MPSKKGKSWGVTDTKAKTGNTVKSTPSANASGNVPRPSGPNASGNSFPGMKSGGKP